MMRLPNIKILLCWSSRMRVYGFVENRTFLEHFVSMGVPARFSNLGYQHNFPIWGYQHIFGALDWCMSFCTILWIIGNSFASYMHGYDMVQIDGG